MALVIPYTLGDAPDAEPTVDGLGRGFGRRLRGITRIIKPVMGMAQPMLGKAGGGILAKAMPFAMPSMMIGGSLLAVGGAAALIKQHQKRKQAKRPPARLSSAIAIPGAAPAAILPLSQPSSGGGAPVALDVATSTSTSASEPAPAPAPPTEAPAWMMSQPSPAPYGADAPATSAADAGPVDVTVVAAMPTSAPSMDVIVPGSAAEVTATPVNPEAGSVDFTDPGASTPSAADQPELVAMPTDAVPADAMPANVDGQVTVGGLGDVGGRPGVPPWLLFLGIGLGAYLLLRRR